jgi:hypothetical protein
MWISFFLCNKSWYHVLDPKRKPKKKGLGYLRGEIGSIFLDQIRVSQFPAPTQLLFNYQGGILVSGLSCKLPFYTRPMYVSRYHI